MRSGLSAVIPSLLLVLLLTAAGCTQPASPAQPAAPAAPVATGAASVTANETLTAFVHEAVAYAREHGRDAALAEFGRKDGSFVRGELYIYAYDNNNTVLAHPVSPELVGRNRLDEPDAFGYPYAWRFRNALTNGSGFLWFYYQNPAQNNRIEQKLGYVERVDETWWLGSGVYYGPVDRAAVPEAGAPRTTQEIKAFVDTAAEYARHQGRETALAAFNDPEGPFAGGDLYVYALDYDGIALALPFQPDLVGTNFSGSQDAGGRFYTRTEIALAREGGGYLLYEYPDPSEDFAVRYKVSYVRPVDDTYWIGAGIYSSEDRLVDSDLREYVDEAKACARTNVKEQALAAFGATDSPFIRGDLYIFAYDYNGTVLAWPYRPDLVGKNRIDETDPMGRHHIRAMAEAAKGGGGMVDYYSVKPATNRTELKISYVTDIDGTWFIGAGRYLEPGATDLRE